jgi:transcription factor IIIB subunit 2
MSRLLVSFSKSDDARCVELMITQGRERIALLARQMNISFHVKNAASRLFDLAVGERFNRGRRSEHVIASCLYLASRLRKETYMLIDFSERLRVSFC